MVWMAPAPGVLAPMWLLSCQPRAESHPPWKLPLADPENHLAYLEARDAPVTDVETRFIVEAIECLYRADKVSSIDDEKARLAQRLPLYGRLLALGVVNPLARAETRHHWGKALKILGRVEEAAKQFAAVMSGPHPLNATGRLYAGNNDRAVELAEEILTAAEVPWR
jgi:hypothetical protein